MEKKGHIKKIMTTIPTEFYHKAKSFGIKWTEALRIGAGILFLERGDKGYVSPLNKFRIELLYDTYCKKENER